jgi:hypothetical protein
MRNLVVYKAPVDGFTRIASLVCNCVEQVSADIVNGTERSTIQVLQAQQTLEHVLDNHKIRYVDYTIRSNQKVGKGRL